MQAFTDVSQLRWIRSERYSLGSGALAGRLSCSLDVLPRLGVTVPGQCRPRNALKFFRSTSEDPTLVRVGDPEFEQLLQAHDRTARDLFTIVYVAGEDRRNPDTPFTPAKLSACLYGPDLDEGRDGESRNTQFELITAATLRLGGAAVFQGKPDLQAEVAGQRVGIEAKRVRSLRDDQFERNVDDAVGQIESSGLPGYLAFNVDRYFRNVDPRLAEEELLTQFGAVFDSLRYRRADYHPMVLGAILFGWGRVLSARPGGALPLLTIVSPVRWERWANDAETAARFNEFVTQWHDRVQRNMSFLMSPEFGTRPL
jgi:hypothetical protein